MSLREVLKPVVVAAAAVLATTAIAASPASAHGRGVAYAALGDSYSAGVGAGPYDLDATCERSSQSYAPQLAADLKAREFTFLACTGATTADVIANQVPGIPAGTTLVTVTTGGNDVGFTNGIVTCFVGSDADCAGAVAGADDIATNQVPASLDALFAAVHAKAPRAEIVLAGYPRFFDGATSCDAIPLDQVKRDAIDGATDTLDGVIKAYAKQHHARYADAASTFAGHSICASEPWINGLVADGPFHPNAAGYAQGFLLAFTDLVCKH